MTTDNTQQLAAWKNFYRCRLLLLVLDIYVLPAACVPIHCLVVFHLVSPPIGWPNRVPAAAIDAIDIRLKTDRPNDRIFAGISFISDQRTLESIH